MNQIKLYHNPRCSKSRAGLEIAQNNNIEIEICDYLKEGLTHQQLENLLVKLNAQPEEIIRTHEEYYKTELKGKSFSKEEWIQIIVENPKLLKRPIFVKGFKAIHSHDSNEILNFLK